MAKLGDKNLIFGAHAPFVLRHSRIPLGFWLTRLLGGLPLGFRLTRLLGGRGYEVLVIGAVGAFVGDSGARFQLGCVGVNGPIGPLGSPMSEVRLAGFCVPAVRYGAGDRCYCYPYCCRWLHDCLPALLELIGGSRLSRWSLVPLGPVGALGLL